MIGVSLAVIGPGLNALVAARRRKLMTAAHELSVLAADAAIAAIRERTGRGVDARGAPFIPYRTGYRSSTGIVGGSLLHAIVFQRSGAARGAIRFTGRHGAISNERLARIMIRGEGSMPKRDFFSWRRGSSEDSRLRAHLRERMRTKLQG